MILTIPADPSDWFYHSHEIYDYFHRRQYSIRYTHAILKFANLWGFFISKKLGHPFLPIPIPRSYERMRIIEASYEKDRNNVWMGHSTLSRTWRSYKQRGVYHIL